MDVPTYLPTTEAAGVRIVVHDGLDTPYPDAFGFSAPTGVIASFGLQKVHTIVFSYSTTKLTQAEWQRLGGGGGVGLKVSSPSKLH